VENTPIDQLDVAAPVSWMVADVQQRLDGIFAGLGLFSCCFQIHYIINSTLRSIHEG